MLRITAAYQSYDGERFQFRDLDFDLRAREINAILGPNGRGKSTLLHVLAGLLKPTSGTLDLNPRTGFVPRKDASSEARRLGDFLVSDRGQDILKSTGFDTIR